MRRPRDADCREMAAGSALWSLFPFLSAYNALQLAIINFILAQRDFNNKIK